MSTTPAPSPEELAESVREALDDGKAVDIRVLEVSARTVITDFMIIATGRSDRQVKALTGRVREMATRLPGGVLGVEGEASGEWVLIDLGDVVVHIMQPETRDFYQLEKLWETRTGAHAEAG